ncbi:phospholipase [Aspergillus fijiensis CBS 313.89]|uniref:Phospholipase A2 n=2 Tax=Aspergillus TaxID=5052 RepID=A0A8G1RYZ3_9EURO|nr:uncharacterized protein BO72DRAFT_491813 [Aspergillus fijiensis CBS 313.89]RAK82190.1 hypothetical protein BO72DRAFT_491813 [Aspergillus fijiensis CBS 313.89]
MAPRQQHNPAARSATCGVSRPTQQQKETCTDYLLFDATLQEFLTYKRDVQGRPPWLDWTDDGCSASMDYPLGFNFHDSCLRHDFGYRNYKEQGRFDHAPSKKAIDARFKQDLVDMCRGVTTPWHRINSHWSCVNCAHLYYRAVRWFGKFGRHVPRVPPFSKKR